MLGRSVMIVCIECCFTSTETVGLLGTGSPGRTLRRLHPNSARFSYVTEGALFISAQVSSDAVSAIQKVRVLI